MNTSGHAPNPHPSQLMLRLRKQLIRDIVNHVHPIGHSMEDINHYYCYHFKPPAFNILILRAVKKDAAASGRDTLNHILSEVEKKMQQELIPIFNDCETAIVKNLLVCVFNITTERISSGTEAFKVAINHFMMDISTALQFNDYYFIMGEGTPAESVLELDNCFLSAYHAMDYSCVEGLNKKFDSNMQVRMMNNVASFLTPTRKTVLKHHIETLDIKKVNALIEEIFKESYHDVLNSPSLAYRLSHKILDVCSSAVEDRIASVNDFSKLLEGQHQLIDNCLTLEDLEKNTQKSAHTFCKQYEKAISESYSPAILSAKIYIQKNFQHPLTLMEIADYVQLNYQYLSVLFKKEIGVSMKEYITHIRIEQAKATLQDSSRTIPEIAEDVGYQDSRYFSRIFKHYVGVRPSEYRQNTSKGKEIHEL